MLFFIVMLHNHRVSAADMSISLGTSAHETGNLEVMNTNALRVWNPETQKRRRLASATGGLRRELCAKLETLPRVKSARIKDTGFFFIALVRLEGSHALRRKACNLRNLAAMLMEALA